MVPTTTLDDVGALMFAHVDNRQPYQTVRRALPRALRLAVIAGFALLSFAFVPRTDAAVIYLKNQDAPVVGYLEQMNDETVALRQVATDGEENLVTIRRDEIDELILAEDGARLGALSPTEIADYRDYAEELAARRIDPEAIDLAIRLYLITAYRGDAQLQQSAFRGLIDIARNGEEEARFRAIAFRTFPDRNRTMLVKTKTKTTTVDSLTPRQRRDLEDAIRLLRSGQSGAAANLARTDSVSRSFSVFESTLTFDAFLNACQRRELPDGIVEKLIAAEIMLLEASNITIGPVEPSEMSKESWGQTVLRAPGAMELVTLFNLTEFDPRLCAYRNGEWALP